MKRKMQVAVCVWYKLYLHTTRCRVNSYHCYWRERPQAAHPTTRSDPASFRRALIALPFCPGRIWQLATAVRTNDRHEETCNGCVCGFGRQRRLQQRKDTCHGHEGAYEMGSVKMGNRIIDTHSTANIALDWPSSVMVCLLLSMYVHLYSPEALMLRFQSMPDYIANIS